MGEVSTPTLLLRDGRSFKASEVCAVSLYQLAHEDDFTYDLKFSREFDFNWPFPTIGCGWECNPSLAQYGGDDVATQVWAQKYGKVIETVCEAEDVPEFVQNMVWRDVYQKVIADIDTKPSHIYPTFGQLIQYLNHLNRPSDRQGFHSATAAMQIILRAVIIDSYRRWTLYHAELPVMQKGMEVSSEYGLEAILLERRCKSINTYLRIVDPRQNIKFILFRNDDGTFTIWTVDYNHTESNPYIRVKAPSHVKLMVKRSGGRMAVAETLRDAVDTVRYSLYQYYEWTNVPARIHRWMDWD